MCFKKTLKITFLGRTPFIVKMEFENMKIFASIFSLSRNILQGKFVAKLKKIESESDIFLQILSEIIELQEKGAVEVIRLKFLISNFTLG